MIDGVTVRTTGFTQCAVCKIDLKGRFVYIDENIEELLGYTKEELFGKSLLHFLDETSQEIINQLLLNRNHYETFYDTTTITLISRRNQPVVARTVFSLNFIAGNPVNFQLVLDVEQTSKHSPNRPVGLMSLEGFLEGIMALESPSEFRGFLGLLRKFTGAHQASLYLIDDKTLEPRSGASDDNSVEFAFTSIPETTALHQRVAESGEIYSFTDEDAVQNAIEEDGTAPNEFVSRLSFDGFRQYLLRLIFSENTEPASMQVAITNTMLALRLVPPLMQIDREGDTASDPTIDVKFTVGFLGNLGIGAILTQSDGRIVGYNQALLEMLGNSKLGDYYTDLIRFLETHTSADLEESVARHFLSSVTEEGCEDLRIPVRFPSGKEQLLIVTRLSDADGDLSACMVLLPWSA
ncbi:MAG: PAS domain-containing protein, partial [candidate division Zixibacteria bacterium]|nr:PAS domain-containing protein [candidate division Zixibacteria bacterium]